MGFTLDPWQELILRNSMKRSDAGLWKTPQVGVCVPRQAGKSELLVARQMFGLFMMPDEKLILASAHLFSTAQESFRKMMNRIDAFPELKARVSRVNAAHGNEGIELKDGSRIRFMARSKGSSRGFSADLIIADEAYDLSDDEMAAILPTLAARPNPQMWYASSAGMPESFVLARVRERGFNKDPRLAYFEWSAPDDADPSDPQAIAQANPGLGIRMSLQHVMDELESLDAETFARERLGVWAKLGGESFIPEAKWKSCASDEEQTLSNVSIGVDVTPDRSSAVVASAGYNTAGKLVVGLLDHREGTDWVAPYLRELIEERGRVGVWIDGTSAASALEPDFKSSRVPKQLIARADYYRACGRFFDLVDREDLVHTDEDALNAAVSAARQGSKGDLWSWSRKDTTADISPLVAATLAVYGAQKRAGGSSRSRRGGSGRGSFFGS